MRNLELRSSADITYVVLIFLVFLLLFHVVLIKFFKQSEVWWKKTDYAWLAAAIISVISASTAWRRFEAQQKLDMAGYIIPEDIDQLSNDLKYATRTACQSAKYSATNRLSTAQRDRRDCEVLSAATYSFERRTRGYRDIAVTESLPSEAILAGLTEIKIGDSKPRSLITLQNNLRRSKKLKDALSFNDLEITLLALAPYVLAVMLALRITKVTADVQASVQKAEMTTLQEVSLNTELADTAMENDGADAREHSVEKAVVASDTP